MIGFYAPKHRRVILLTGLMSCSLYTLLGLYNLIYFVNAASLEIQIICIVSLIACQIDGVPQRRFVTVIQGAIFCAGILIAIALLQENLQGFFLISTPTLSPADFGARLLAGRVIKSIVPSLIPLLILTFLLQWRIAKQRNPLVLTLALIWLFVIVSVSLLPVTASFLKGLNPFIASLSQQAVLRWSCMICNSFTFMIVILTSLFWLCGWFVVQFFKNRDYFFNQLLTFAVSLDSEIKN